MGSQITFGMSDVADATRRGIPEDGRFTTHDPPRRLNFLQLEASGYMEER